MEFSSEQVIENIINVDPELKKLWDEMIVEDYGSVADYDKNKEDSVDMITIIDYIIESVETKKTTALQALFQEIEKGLVHGDEYTSELIAVSFLEGLQNAGRIREIDYHNVFHEWFQDETKRIYNGLIAIWEGRNGVAAIDEENRSPELEKGEEA